MPGVCSTAGVTLSVRLKPLSTIDRTPSAAIRRSKLTWPAVKLSVRGDHGSGHVGRLGTGVDDLDRGDVVVESAVVGRRVGDDDLAGSVNRDRPLVACPIRTRDNLALIAQERAVRVIVLHQAADRVGISLVGDRVGDVEIARSVERQVTRKLPPRATGGSRAVLVCGIACAGPNRAGQTAAAWNSWKTPFPATRQAARPPIMRPGPPTDGRPP